MAARLECLAPTHAPAPRSTVAGDRASPVLASAGPLDVLVARDRDDVVRAQRLRYQVFAEELGAVLDPTQGIDRDVFDSFCQHLIVRERATGEVVGTYRLLLPEQAAELGGLYSDGEFVLDRLDPLRPQLVELGRSCVHADHRSGAVIMLLWSGLGALLARTRLRYLVGCVSVSIRDGGDFAASLYHRLARTHMADASLRAWPRRRLELERLDRGLDVVPPPLFKGYLRAGARLLGEPHVDGQFACADFPVMLDLAALQSRYQRRFAAGPVEGAAQ
ncbi:MAG: GNAT family N-acetyltransferase [Burkholderiaceae bacterium]|nr:GNAT family N-acetyltransferase [Burkholderiaceae bacterium]